jgi:hypothetical protein
MARVLPQEAVFCACMDRELWVKCNARHLISVNFYNCAFKGDIRGLLRDLLAVTVGGHGLVDHRFLGCGRAACEMRLEIGDGIEKPDLFYTLLCYAMLCNAMLCFS